jgi:cell division protein FtsW (lipid II flippase)
VRRTRSIELTLILCALAFGWVGAASLWLQRSNAGVLLAMALLSACAVITHVWLNRVAPARDPFLFPPVVLLTSFGLLSISRVAPNFLGRQMLSLIIATLALLVVASGHDQLRWLRRFKYTWLIAAFALLFATLLFGVNPAGIGARLWLSVAGAFFQPSEVLRLLLIAFLAAYFAERLENSDQRLHNAGNPPHRELRQSPLSNPQSLLPTVAMWLVAFALLVTQQDLGAAMLLLVTFVFMLYLATGSARLPAALLVLLVVAGGAGYVFSSRVAQRIDIWLNPFVDPQGSSFQVVQSLIAVANGGLFGQGINQGRPDYVPAVHTDFPFVMVSEEFGLLGALALIAAFAVLCLRAWRVCIRSHTPYRLLLAGGIAAALSFQVFVIIGGNLALVPLTGVTLPFVSYGGSSLLVSYIAVGLLLRISADESSARSNAVLRRTARSAGHAMQISVMLLIAVAVTAGFWSVVQAQPLTVRSDNPRLIDAELAIERGSIVDRNGVMLAASERVTVTNNVPRFTRVYSHTSAAPAVGYYSQRYGAGGMEAFADATLRGSYSRMDDLLHRRRIGQPVTLTLDSALQSRLFNAISTTTTTTATRGAAVVMNWRTSEVLALVSAPSFDANQLDAQWDALRMSADAPLLNRATQGLYQPGGLLQWLVKTDNAKTETSWLLALGSLGFDKPVPFELKNEALPLPATATYSETIGQGQLRVTPLRIATTVATLTANQLITPTLLKTRPDDLRPDDLRPDDLTSDTFITFAPFGVLHVGWLVQVKGDLVMVIALEQRTPDAPALRRVADVIEP